MANSVVSVPDERSATSGITRSGMIASERTNIG